MGGVTRTFAFTSDASGNRTQILHPDGAAFDYYHDGLNRLSYVYQNYGPQLVGLLYNGQGRRRVQLRWGASAAYAYDGAGRLSVLAQTLFGTPEASWDSRFAYNPASQIVQAQRSNDLYAYAALATQNVTDTHNGLNQVTQTGGIGVTHDANGNTSSDGATDAASATAMRR